MRKKWLIFFGLWMAATAYILLFPTRHFTADGINNLVFIEGQDQFELWHSQHILAQWPGYWLYQLMGGQIRAWEAIRYAHAFLAGAAVALVFAAILELTDSFPIAIVSGLVLCFSYGFWHYQSDPDIYSAGYAAVALMLLAYVRFLKQPGTGRIWALGLAASLAMLTHQLNLEWAGLIGLSLIWLAWREARAKRAAPLQDAPQVSWKQVGVYALICAVLVFGVYLVGYAHASDALVQAGGSHPPLIGWILGYFNKAQAGEATWGVSLRLDTLPLAGYTFVGSWILPPRVSDLTIWSGALLALLAVSSLVLLVHLTLVLRRLPHIPRIIAVTCALTLFLNGISGWWWQAGNIKFYLFMQINLITLAALYAQEAFKSTMVKRRISQFALGGTLLSLILLHITLTLPYETQGGVFAAAAQAEHDGTSAVWFDTVAQAEALHYISDQTGQVLRGNFCQSPPAHATDSHALWIVSQQKAANCPPLANATQVGSFQADRSRQVWLMFTLP